jgi:hypothetical protein
MQGKRASNKALSKKDRLLQSPEQPVLTLLLLYFLSDQTFLTSDLFTLT